MSDAVSFKIWKLHGADTNTPGAKCCGMPESVLPGIIEIGSGIKTCE